MSTPVATSTVDWFHCLTDPPDEETTDIFCIDFILKTYPENAGCDRCGVNDRKEGSNYCEDCDIPGIDPITRLRLGAAFRDAIK